ncbi:acylphosphatase [Phenylobacterium sp.]|uniref:acylphosphatase n=1 Tax=Phenylobacterium sp. TaxID=1871053 RepID=UPI0035AE9161
MREAELFRIEGRVQGVGYRWWAVQTARRLGLDGWVRNRRDGSVELLAIGPRPEIDALAAACAEGPAAARVQRVARAPGTDDGAKGFHERPTE